jgi:hypothetical protein
MRWTTKSTKDRQLLEDTIRAIEEDKSQQAVNESSEQDLTVSDRP